MMQSAPPPGFLPYSPQAATVVAAVNDFGRHYCVYEHYNAEDVLMFVGVSKIVEAFMFQDARQNSEWVKIFTADTPLIMKIVLTTPDLHIASNYRHRIITTQRPHCNAYGFSMLGIRAEIICDQTNERFATITEAARAHGISASALSNHLNNKVGHKSVKGKTYRKGI